jgi:membrane protein
MNASTAWSLLKDTYTEWSEDKASRLAASLAYYTAFSIAPLVILTIAIAGFFFGEEAVSGQLNAQLTGTLGQQGADAVTGMVAAANQQEAAGIVATIIGIATLLFGASGVFVGLQDALNTIWGVAPRPDLGIWTTIRQRFLSFGMILVIGFVLLVSLVVSAALGAVTGAVDQAISSPLLGYVWSAVNFVVSFGVITLLFALIYKVLPDATVAWGDVWIGAGVTALLFTIGKALLSLYLGNAAVASSYGAAGSLIVLLLWVYYSAQILFFGAEFTQVYAKRFGSQIKPTENAVPLDNEMRANQGIPTNAQLQTMTEQHDEGQERTVSEPLRSLDKAATTTAQAAEAAPRATRLGAVVGFVVGLFIARRREQRP